MAFVADCDGRLQHANSELVRYTGIPAETLLAEGWRLAIHADEVEEAIRTWARQLRCGDPVRNAYRVRHHDGTYRYCEFSASPVRDGGAVLCWIGTVIETHRPEQSEQVVRDSAELIRALDVAMPDPMFVKDSEGRFLAANAAALHALGKPIEEVVGRKPSQIYEDPRTGAELAANDRRVLESGEALVFEETVQTPDGARVFLSTKARLEDSDGNTRGIVGIARDITERKRAEEKLREHAELLKLSHDAIVVMHGDGEIVSWNNGAQELYGFTEAEALGHCIGDLLNTEYPFGKSDVDAYLNAHGRWEGELRQSAKDGRSIIVSTRLQLVKGSNGTERILAVTRDVTERRQADERLRTSEERFKAFMNNSPTASWVVDEEGRFVYLNPTYLKMFGVGQSLLGKRISDVYPAHIAQEYLENNRRALSSGCTLEAVESGIRGDGLPGTFLVLKFPIVEPGGSRLLGGIAVDISERKKMEEMLVEASQRKDQFLAVLSHKLRNPLAPIRNSLVVLDRAPAGSEHARRAKAVLDRQVAHMSRLVDDLLDVTRIARGKVQLRIVRLDVVDLVAQAVEDYRDSFSSRGVEFTARLPKDPIWADCDPVRLGQVVGNLLQNALKFTPTGGQTEIAVTADATAACVICVRDTGVGISREMLPRLFQPFTQADDTLDRSQGGLGLGLALVKGLVELHGGAVEVHSAGAAQGSEFVVRLPLPKLQSVASAQSADRAGRRAGKRQCRILIIDDNVDAALSLRDALELSDYVVETADTGAHGLQRARAFHPNVILCDIGLPVMDGYDVALAVRADSLLRNTYLVALTGYALPEDIAKAQAAGFNRHIAKPPKLDEIERAVAEGCGIDSARSHTGGIGSRPSNS